MWQIGYLGNGVYLTLSHHGLHCRDVITGMIGLDSSARQWMVGFYEMRRICWPAGESWLLEMGSVPCTCIS